MCDISEAREFRRALDRVEAATVESFALKTERQIIMGRYWWNYDYEFCYWCGRMWPIELLPRWKSECPVCERRRRASEGSQAAPRGSTA